MDKATPTPPATVDSFMSLLRNHENRISETYGVLQDRRIPSEEVRAAIDASWEARNALIAEVERLAAQAAPTEPNSDLPTYTDDLELRYVEACEERDHLRAVLRAQSPAQAPVMQAVQAVELIEQEMAMLIRRLCSTTANDKTRAQAMEYLFKRGHASPLRAESEPAQAMDHPPLPEGVKARFKCEDCDGTGYTGEMIPGSEFQPPEPVGCTSCRFTGWWAECEAYSADQMHAYLDADRASSGAAQAAPRCVTCDGTGEVHRADGTWVGTCFCAEGKRAATTQAVRMLTDEEKVKAWNHDCNALLSYADAVIRAFCAVNAGKRIPASGEIGGV